MTYVIKIKKIEIENILDTLISKPFFSTKDNQLARRIGINLKQLRKDGKLTIANDKRTGESVVILRKMPEFSPISVKKIKGRRVTYEIDDLIF